MLTAYQIMMLFLLLACISTEALAQNPSPNDEETAPISDNSFLIEEAYNQEPGVVQHISTFTRNRIGDFSFTFTQELPIVNQRHQFSYTVPVARVSGESGFGDIALNYRYQIVNNARIAVAPRATLLVPTGDFRKDFGRGTPGFQFNFPVSTQLSSSFVAHTNAGATITPGARNTARERATTQDYFLGQSIVWLAKPRFNVLLETLYEDTESVTGEDLTARDHAFTINPGVRFAFNFRRSGLQIVPGLSVPIGVGPSHGERAIFFYLSFEHPFGRRER